MLVSNVLWQCIARRSTSSTSTTLPNSREPLTPLPSTAGSSSSASRVVKSRRTVSSSRLYRTAGALAGTVPIQPAGLSEKRGSLLLFARPEKLGDSLNLFGTRAFSACLKKPKADWKIAALISRESSISHYFLNDFQITLHELQAGFDLSSFAPVVPSYDLDDG